MSLPKYLSAQSLKARAQNFSSSEVFTSDGLLFVLGVHSVGGRNFERTWKIINNSIEEILDSFIFESRAASDRHQLVGDRRTAKASLEISNGDGLLHEELLPDLAHQHQRLLQEVPHSVLGKGELIIVKISNVVGRTKNVIVVVENGLLIKNVDLAAKILFGANWNQNANGACTELLLNFFDSSIESQPLHGPSY